MRNGCIEPHAFRLSILAAAVLVASTALAAERDPGPIQTDRPDQTEASTLVPRGLVQIEAGYNFFTADLDGEETEISEIPSTLVRYGLAEEVELRFFWAGMISTSTKVNSIDSDDSGVGNTALGAKIKLIGEEKGGAPKLALLVDALLPTGDKTLRSDRIDPALRVSGSHTLSERFGLGWNIGGVWATIDDDSGDADTLGVGVYTVALGIGVNDRWNAFVEAFGFIPASGRGGPENLLDGGFTYLSRNNLQFDFSGGFGISDSAVDWFAGLGFSIRLPR